MPAKLITPPSVEPITLALAKLHCYIDADDRDELVSLAIGSARRHVEQWCDLNLITQTWELALDAFPCGPIRLPGWPLQSVTSIEYLDANGDPQTVDPGTLSLDTFSRPGWVTCSSSWPQTQDAINAVRVRYVLGYGAAGSDVPAPVRSAMLLVVGDLMENRQAGQKDMINVNPAVESLLFPFRLLTP